MKKQMNLKTIPFQKFFTQIIHHQLTNFFCNFIYSLQEFSLRVLLFFYALIFFCKKYILTLINKPIIIFKTGCLLKFIWFTNSKQKKFKIRGKKMAN